MLREQVCKECRRGHSGDSNDIVFCADCGTPYHQLCHKPPIDRIMVDIPNALWFCCECMPKHQDSPLVTGVEALKYEQPTRLEYLTSLSKSQLIQLILYAETLKPDLPLYPPNTNEIVKSLRDNGKGSTSKSGISRPSYEEDVVQVISQYTAGLTIPEIWPAFEKRLNLNANSAIKHSATRALQRALRRGRLVKVDNRYYINSDYQPSSEITLEQLLRADDQVMFAYMPLRLTLEDKATPHEEGEAISHRVYAQTAR